MANEDIVLSIGVDVAGIKSDVLRASREAEAILKNQKLVANLAFQFGTSQANIRSEVKDFYTEASYEWNRLVGSGNLGKFIVDTSMSNQEAMKKANEDLINSLPRLRYALYDVANGFNAVAQNATAFGGSIIKTSMEYETAFTNVERVTNLNVKQTAALRDELKNLATQIPLTFQDITSISTLGAQLGISEENLTSFTGTVSKFSAVANVSNESAAQSFGALSTLLNLSQADFEKFGSSVAYAGSQSVATESEILGVATQIGGVAGPAGFSAEKVVGLSTALASLRIPAEQSRGALIRTFSEINRAVAENGDQLQMFAAVLGTSAEEASKLAQTNMPQFFDSFIQGLQNLNPQQLTQTFDALNLADTRVVNTLTRLSAQYGVVRSSQDYASKGFQDGTFLADSFAKKSDDLASKLIYLQNAVANLADTAGQMFAPAFGFILDVLKNVIVGLEIFIQTPIGKIMLIVAAAATAAAIAIGTFAGVVLTALAGTLAFATALTAVEGAAGGGLVVGLVSIISAITGVEISASAAAAALTVFKFALLASGVGIAVAVIGAAVSGVVASADAANKASGATSNWAKTVSNASAKNKQAADSAASAAEASADWNKQMEKMGSGGGGGTAGKAAEKIRTLKDYANDLSAVFSRAFEIRFSGTQALDSISKSFSSMAKSTADARDEISGLNADIQTLTADKALQEYFLSVAEAYGDTLKAQEIRANLAKIDSDLTKKTKDLSKAQDKTNKTLIGNSDAAVSNRSEIINLVQQYESYVKSLANSGMKQDQLALKTAQLKADFIAQATQLGYNQDELAYYAAAFDDVTFAISNVPRNVSIEVDIDPNPAVTALNEILAAGQSAASGIGGAFQQAADDINSALQAEKQARIEATLYEDDIKRLGETFQKFAPPPVKNNVVSRFTGINPFQRKADGGPIYGAGTSRSDSIPAMLSNGEYVIQASAVKEYGVGFFNQLNQMKTPRFFSGGGPVTQQGGGMVSLSPEDRALLRNVGGSGNIVLYADSKELARSVNDGNRQIVAAGGRP